MRDKFSKSNINTVSGNVFNGPTNIVSGNNTDFNGSSSGKTATYTPEPVWRSPITMAILSWMGIFISLIGIFPFYKLFEPLINLFTNKSIQINANNNIIYLGILVIVIILLAIIAWLRDITKRETRHPLFFNYAISGLRRKLTIEKIHIDKCPICGGTMKYFNKAVEWENTTYPDGKPKRKVTQKVPALQCKRNPDHFFEVDPAADKLDSKSR
ncbi:hypothetical protein SD927_00225 [Lactobacillus iners]|uniref:hypothetical protein n=1 Tax=Lactobacillus iners TaxID=147802 RepID=UPI0001E9B799|nr:hypothetical protein [Lactobacillus iners]DAP70346.1 MAG TPA: MqsA [Caudoviricetes sp.]EFQ47489.1 hypothetical protein HMPREF9216_0898 [Lactobacillus iners LEAF 2053A-b]MCT7724469.1 hypothetical protein [Lactobacillus iners]MCZ9654842.1 hypothetical protein [Lactobacillus iners]MDK7306340.1 hypothetical protein [Lactobacillus iners]